MTVSQKDLFDGCRICGIADGMAFTGIASDSRKVKPGNVFVCHRGIHRDGRKFAADALMRGAAAVVADSAIDGVAAEKLFLTDDTRLAESLMWHNFTGRASERMKAVAVTGTAGKTSVVYLLEKILSSAGYRVGTLTTVRAESRGRIIPLGENGGSSVTDIAGAMTTPDPEYFYPAVREMADDGCEILIYEASSQGILNRKNAAVRNAVAVFTNLSPEHLDCHGTMENYFAAKAELMKTSSAAVINADDEWLSRLPEMFPTVPCTRCSMKSGGDADVFGVNYKSYGADGGEYMYLSDSAVFRVRTPIIGKWAAYNTLEAATAALLLGAAPINVKEALKDSTGAPGRMEKVSTGVRSLDSRADISVFIDYAHTPEALRSILISARECGGEVTVVFGCGGERDRTKRAPMGEIASRYADRVIVTRDNPRGEDERGIISDILAGADGKDNVTVIADRRDAIHYAISSAEAGGIVLLAGKGHEKYEILADGKHPFDEYAEAADALTKRLG